MSPDLEVLIGDEMVVVREYRFAEGLAIHSQARDLIQALRDLAEAPDEIPLDALEEVFGHHHEAILTMIAKSCDRSTEWVSGLPDAEGRRLMTTWWEANANFFMRRFALSLLLRRSNPEWDGAPSSPA